MSEGTNGVDTTVSSTDGAVPAAAPRILSTETGRAILRHGARLFFEQGYERTTIRDIADSVGILNGSLYHHIREKSDILYWIIRSAHSELLVNVEANAALDASAFEKLQDLLERHVMFVVDNLHDSAAFNYEFITLSAERRKEIIRARDSYEHYFRSLVEQAQADGDLRDDVDPGLFSRGAFSMLNGIHRWYRPRGGMPKTELAREHARLLLFGVVRHA
jgi:AcrR family transcriptional regulator